MNKKQINRIQNIKLIIMGLIILLFFYLYFTDNHLIHTLNCKDTLLLKHWNNYLSMNYVN